MSKDREDWEARNDKGVAQPHSITSSREALNSSRSLAIWKPKSSRKEISTAIAKLAVHYYRPDFTPEHAKLLFADFAEDLRDYPIDRIEDACRAYRRDPENRFFPTPGQLRAYIPKPPVDTGPKVLPYSARPTAWWMMPREQWRPEWRDAEVPEEFQRPPEKVDTSRFRKVEASIPKPADGGPFRAAKVWHTEEQFAAMRLKSVDVHK